jgi:serine/threonine protein kinase
MAPEAIGKRKYSQKSDVWSFGIVGICHSLIHSIFFKNVFIFFSVTMALKMNSFSLGDRC